MLNEKQFDKQVEEFKSALHIDRNALDEAVIHHPSIYMQVQEAYTQAASVRDAAKTSMEETYANCALKARKNAAKADGKWTESHIKDEVAVDDDYLQAIADVHDSEKRYRLLGALVSAFDQRGRMLKELIALYIAGYFTLSGSRQAQNGVATVDAEMARKAMSAGRRPVVARK